MPLKICLLSDHHVCINPRLWKEAFFYEKRGYDVVIISMWQSQDLLNKDLQILNGHDISYKAFLNMIPGQVGKASRFFYRLRTRAANELQRFLKIPTRWAINYAPKLLVRKALQENAFLYSAHLECALFAGKELIQAGKKVSYDFEDWYSHDYLVPERPVKLLESLEKFAVNNGLFCTAASESMAMAIKQYYYSRKDITVIFNGFPNQESDQVRLSENSHSGAPLKLLWFSRNIGPNRGIELFLKSIVSYHKPLELHLLGKMTPGYGDMLTKQFANKNRRLIFYSFIPHNQLPAFISQFGVGLAMEENINANRSLTITNKILQYLQMGLYVLASDTKGHKEVAAILPSAVKIIDLSESSQVINALDFLENRITYSQNPGQMEKFKKIFSWEAQENKLEHLLEKHI